MPKNPPSAFPAVVEISLCHKLRLKVRGRYTEGDFHRVVSPTLSEHDAKLTKKSGNTSVYELAFDDAETYMKFLRTLDKKLKILHPYLTYDMSTLNKKKGQP
jgi:hypothetical protein